MRWLLLLGAAALALAGCSSAVGDACTTDQDCGGRTCELSGSDHGGCGGATCFPGGYCSEHCTVGDNGTCPTGSDCVSYVDGPLCLRQCADNTECRNGYLCTSHGDGSYCLAAGG